MTTVYVLSILLAFSLAGSAWLGWLLYEAREDRDEFRHALAQARAAHAMQADANHRTNTDNERAIAALVSELAMTRLVRDVFAQQLADTFAMPTVHGHDAEITSPAASEQPSPLYDETARYFASRRLGAVR